MESTVTHRNSSSLKVANNVIIGHFSLLLLLGLAQFHGRKPIFRGTLKLMELEHDSLCGGLPLRYPHFFLNPQNCVC